MTIQASLIKTDLPLLAEDLINELAQSIPARCPLPHESEREIWMYVGKRLVVESLIQRLKAKDRGLEDDPMPFSYSEF